MDFSNFDSSCQHIIQQGIWKKVGRGNQTKLWQDNLWQWNFLLRQNLFAWEQEMLQDLLELISQYSFVDGLDDQLLWKFDTSGNFSIKSFSV